MEKKQYIAPCSEIIKCDTALMKYTGDASLAAHPAPRRRTSGVF